MCPRSTSDTISGCHFWTPLKLTHTLNRPHNLKFTVSKVTLLKFILLKVTILKVTLLKVLLLKVTLHRIHTIEGYAFAGSEHISMLVINDTKILLKISFNNWNSKGDQRQPHQNCWLFCVCRAQARQVPPPLFQCQTSACGGNKQILRSQEYGFHHSASHRSYHIHHWLNNHTKKMIRMHSTGWSQWNIWNSTFSIWTTPSLTLSGDFRQLILTCRNLEKHNIESKFSKLLKLCVFRTAKSCQ